MAVIEIGGVRELVESAVTAISVLGGTMACLSGFLAALAMSQRRGSEELSQGVNEGVGQGFVIGTPLAIAAFIIEVWL